jgi:2-oxoglutarate ferredoxin oxidoreductase subunit gamma
MGNMKFFNMVILGGFLKVKPIVKDEFIEKGLQKSLPARHHGLIPDNIRAIEVGREILKPIQVL